jgi:ATP-dependent Lon protease
MKNENSIIKIQKKFAKLKKELEILNSFISFNRDYLLGMINNLVYMNNLKIFQEQNMFISLLNELKFIKDEFNKIPYIVRLKDLKIKKLSFYRFKIIRINILIKKYSNHITSDNFNFIFMLFIDNNCLDYFYNLEQISFITRFIKPVSIWDSECHSVEVPYNFDKEKTNNINIITKDIIDCIMELTSKQDHESRAIYIKTIETIKPPNNKPNSFNKDDCLEILGEEYIKIIKLDDIINGVNIYIKLSNSIIVIQGIMSDDILNLSHNYKFVRDKFNLVSCDVSKTFKDRYLKIISLRDIIVCSHSEISELIKKKFIEYKNIHKKNLTALMNDFVYGSKNQKIDILTLLLISNKEDQKLANVIFDFFKTKDKKDVISEIYQSLHYTIRDLLVMSKKIIESEEKEILKITESDIPYDKRIFLLDTTDDIKAKGMEKFKAIKSSFQGDSKAQSWLDGFLRIPFGKYCENDIINFKSEFIKKTNETNLFSDNDIDYYINNLKLIDNSNPLINEWLDYKSNKKQFIKDIRSNLDSAVYGHKEAKIQLERLFAQWVNGETKGAILGLQGPPGTGKTSLAKNGLSKCLKDKNGKPRPFTLLPIGGSVNGSTLVGHGYAYVGATWGRIADILMISGYMNPIIFIDEVDKISNTDHGREITSILTHLTDATQNDEFEDKYFAGIKLDLSKALIVLSFNDPDLIDPILKDRITIIETHPLSIKEKIVIINEYMLPEICKDVGFNKSEIIMSESIIKYVIETYTNEAGVRKVKEKIVEIVRDINLNRFHSDEYQLPFTITEEYIKKLFENKPKVRVKKLSTKPQVGLVNGLYATASGLGGLTIIQCTKFPSEKLCEIKLTGKAGDVMKESVEYSQRVAWSLLTKEEQDILIQDANNKKTFGIHIHCPDGATPKDGPSAGAAFTLAIYSILTDKKVNNKVAMTGEIDLLGNVTAIGGLESKINGAFKAGIEVVLIPEENKEDYERLQREKLIPEINKKFKIHIVNNINQVMKYALKN